MKTNSKKMAAEIASALTDATLVKSGSKKIMKKIDAVATKMARKINKRIVTATGSAKKKAVKKEEKTGKNKKGQVAGKEPIPGITAAE